MCSMPPASGDVDGAERDLAGGRGDRGERAGAHAVDREAGHGLGDAGEERDVAAERQPLVADLGRRGEDDVADPLRRDLRVSPQQLAHGLDAHVVGARAPELALRARPCRTASARRRRRRPRAPPASTDDSEVTERSISRSTLRACTGAERAEEAIERYRAGATRGFDQRQLTQLGERAWAAGLCLSMAGRVDESARVAPARGRRYRESWEAGAPEARGAGRSPR